jgi:hypothetical protein
MSVDGSPQVMERNGARLTLFRQVELFWTLSELGTSFRAAGFSYKRLIFNYLINKRLFVVIEGGWHPPCFS